MNLSVDLEFLSAWCWVTDLSNVESLGLLSSFFLTEAEKTILERIISFCDWHLSEACCITFKGHGLLFLNVIKLDLRVDISGFVLVQAYQVAPCLARVDIVRHDLAF